jgi:hypothetical protein
VSDMVNGDIVVEHMLEPTVIVECVEDAGFALSAIRSADEIAT